MLVRRWRSRVPTEETRIQYGGSLTQAGLDWVHQHDEMGATTWEWQLEQEQSCPNGDEWRVWWHGNGNDPIRATRKEPAMNDERFDRITRHVSRRGLVSAVAAGLFAAPAAGALGARGRKRGKRSPCLGKPPRDTCGGHPTELSRCCAGLRTCSSDEDCAPGCECVERGAGCCFKVRRGKHLSTRRCVDFRPALRCTPRADQPRCTPIAPRTPTVTLRSGVIGPATQFVAAEGVRCAG